MRLKLKSSRPPRGSLVGRLIVLAAIWSLAVLIATGVALTGFFRQAALERFQEGVFDVAEGLFAGTTVRRDGVVIAPPFTDARATRVFSGKYWQIAEPTPNGVRPLIRSRSLWDKTLPGPPAGREPLVAELGRPVYYDARGPAGEALRAAAIMALLPGRTEPLIFMAAQDRGPVDEAANRFAVLTAFALVALGAGLVLAVVLQVRLGLAPLFDLGREIADVRKGKAPRLSARYPAEIAPLADEMNALLDHNQQVVERQRTHVGNLAHALKTPLAVITGEAESSARDSAFAGLVTRQAAVMQGQIDHHLRRARAAARAQTLGERTLVEPALDELAGMLERVFHDKGVEIDWRCPETLCFRGERQDLLEIIGNLLENACKWSKRRVRVLAELEGEDQLRLTVEDDGPGLPDEQRAEVLKRGARLDETAPGSGLGLSIVDELVRAYGGRVELARAELGGLKVQLWLPRAEN